MLRSIFSSGVLALVALCFLQPANAGPLTSAEVTKIINRVAVVDPATGQQPAKIRDVIKDDLGLQTGEKSRSELLFQDNTLTRIGAETFFSFKTGTRDMTLEKGSMLLQVPKGLGGATIHTAAVTAAITGTTIMMEYIPGRYIKVLVLEGSLRLSRNGRFGDSLVLRPGKMVIMRPDAKRIPEPVDVDIKHIVQSSTLVNFPDSAPLPSMGLIQEAIASQTQSIARNDLVPTNLVMAHGTDVVLATNDQLARITALTPTAVNANSSATAIAPTTSPTNIVPLPVSEPATAIVDPAPTTTAVNAAATSPTSAPVTAALLATPSSTLTSTVSNVAATVPATLNDLTSTVSSLPVVNSLTASVPTTVNALTNTVTSLPVVSSITGTVAALPTVLDPITSAVTSPVLNSVTATVSAVPATLGSLTTTVSALPVVNTVTAPLSSLSGTLNSVTSAVAPSSLVSSIAGVTGTTTPTSSIGSSANTILLTSTNTITSMLGSTTTAANPITTTAITAPTPQPVSVTSSNQLVSLLSSTAPTTSGQITISPTSLTSISPTGTSAPAPGSTTAVTTSTSSPVTTIVSGTTGTLTTTTRLPTTTTTATPAPITTTITSLFGRH